MDKLFIGDLIYILNKDLFRKLEEVLKHKKMNLGQLQTLMTIKRLEIDKKTNQDKLTKAINLNKSNICRSLKKLSAEGLVNIETTKTDARKNTIQITPEGEEELENLKYELQEINKNMLEGISEQEQEIVQIILVKMINNLIGE